MNKEANRRLHSALNPFSAGKRVFYGESGAGKPGLRRRILSAVKGRTVASRDRTACGWECDRGFSP
ncbi:hypothetical protein [Phormidium sp. CCY1219]|uniref:hypothetical protein n=1 Tax=Phormidium sp. CCY1219 TaxID=2886104 RepID=UPI002D1EFE65|nr:hypothetical protein [Phormidium sp. CCY1219]MEB3827273.1 hypothetical protein [Phormidium sp. CCY1219]